MPFRLLSAENNELRHSADDAKRLQQRVDELTGIISLKENALRAQTQSVCDFVRGTALNRTTATDVALRVIDDQQRTIAALTDTISSLQPKKG